MIQTSAGHPAGAPAGRHPRPRRRAARRATAPDAIAIEELYFGANVRTAFAVGQARGVVLLAAGQRGIPSRSYTPQQVKAAVCGHGRAGKDQVGRMVARMLGLAAPPTPDHAADALAVAICDLNRAPLASALAREPARDRAAVGQGRGPARRPRGRRLRRRRLPAGGLGRDAAARARRRTRGGAAHAPGRPRRRARAVRLRHRGGAGAVPDAARRAVGGAQGRARGALRRAAAGPARGARGRRHGAAAGRARDRQAHRRADHRRAAREGRRGAARAAITITRADDPALARPRGPDRARLQPGRRPTSCSSGPTATSPRT